ncbi:replication initiation negative regulator SeqA [Alteromonas sp. 1_MG-2023]|uniref:replication initiation negative regulator SeqA n=1 Tax=Alteromonas sp. 1_MG-2023 TaxID=3062669 RepID=UPI0026E17267|nr:replication initiation negative regulator SeqA [Alteromonas sp. 1_MG-2023]MDO6567421.1 replication initiation negative regulator SeqA [Alteromonas sp. 1_MG-2023]
MKSIEIDDDLYAFIASQTKHIGESASEILRRLLLPEDGEIVDVSESALSDDPSQATKAQAAEPASESDTTTSAAKALAQKADAKPAVKTVASKTASTAAKTTTKAAPKATSAKTPVAKTAAKAPIKKDVAAPVVPDTESHNKDDIVGLVSADALSTFTKRVDQFLFILSAAHKLNSDNFDNVKSIIGKNRTYFATSKEALLENGSSTNPKAIPDSPFWVVTNNNTAKKVNMLEQVLRTLGYKPDVVETVVSRFAPEGK